MKKIYFLAAFFLLLGSVNTVTARPPMPPPPGQIEHSWKQEDQILAKIDTTDEQKEKINQLREQFRKDIEPLKSQRYEIMAELKLMWMARDVDYEKIRVKARAFHELVWKVMERNLEYKIELRSVLTKEQYQLFLEAGGYH
jgi:Spy/CpxP family protein refolding chaperone